MTSTSLEMSSGVVAMMMMMMMMTTVMMVTVREATFLGSGRRRVIGRRLLLLLLVLLLLTSKQIATFFELQLRSRSRLSELSASCLAVGQNLSRVTREHLPLPDTGYRSRRHSIHPSIVAIVIVVGMEEENIVEAMVCFAVYLSSK